MNEDELYKLLITETLATLTRTNEPSPPVVIAFCGIPGSGKTTLGKRLADDLKLHYIRQDAIRFKAREHGFENIKAHEVSMPVMRHIMSEYANKSVLLDASIDRTWRSFFATCKEVGAQPFVIRIIVDFDEAIERIKKRGDPNDIRLLDTLQDRQEEFIKCLTELPAHITLTSPYEYEDVLPQIKERLAEFGKV